LTVAIWAAAITIPAFRTEAAEKESLTLHVPGSTASLQFGGYAEVNLLQHFDSIGDPCEFKMSTIAIDGTPEADQGGRTTVSAKETRLHLEFRSDDTPDRVRVYVEGDFFGSGDGFRLRHAYGVWRSVLGGQTWLTFMDIGPRPFTIDYEGPDAEVFQRQPQIRYTGHASQHLEFAIAVENPASEIDVTSPTTGVGRSSLPDLPAHLRYASGRDHFQIAGVIRQLRFVSDSGLVDESTGGFGVDVSGKIGFGANDAIMGLFAIGERITHYVETFRGLNADAVYTPSGSFEALPVVSATGGITHHWSARTQSTLTGSFAKVDNDPSQSGSAMKAARLGHFNVVHSPTAALDFGVELSWGERENADGSKGQAMRGQLALKYKLPGT
jgi:hypothetical protein